MNLGDTYQSVRAFRVEALRRFGFTPRQAEFLAHVLVFSGVFMERQYCHFAGISHGRKTHDFLRLLVDRGYATVIIPGKAHAGRLYHVHYKPLYEAIRLPNSRNRRRVTLGRFIERLMLLDVVLGDRDHCWLGTEQDKVGYFQKVERMGRTVALTDLPRVVYKADDERTTRYFPDKLPIGIERTDGDRHLFVFLVRQPHPSEFRIFLARHAELLGSLYEWTVRLIIPSRLAGAKNLHVCAFRDDVTRQIRHSEAEEFKDYLRAKHAAPSVPTSSPVGRQEGPKRFGTARFQALERIWSEGGPTGFSMLDSPFLKEHLQLGRGRLEVMVLPHKYLHMSALVGVA